MQLPVFSLCLATTGFFRLHPVYVSQMTAQTLPSLIFARHKRSRWITWTFCGPVACLFSFSFPQIKVLRNSWEAPIPAYFPRAFPNRTSFLAQISKWCPFFSPPPSSLQFYTMSQRKSTFQDGDVLTMLVSCTGLTSACLPFFFFSPQGCLFREWTSVAIMSQHMSLLPSMQEVLCWG